MVIYADILICLNIAVNYLIISATSRICKITAKNSRIVLGAFIGSLFSLYIFLPKTRVIVDLIFKLTFSALIIIVSFGCKKIKSFLKHIIVFFCVSFVYAGLMLGVWYIAKPNGMVVNNGIVYFSISPIVMIFFSLLAYGLMLLYDKIHKSQANINMCLINITCGEKTVAVNALVDSGNLLKDNLSDSQVVIVQKDVGNKLFGHITLNTPLYMSGDINSAKNFRVIPYKTVSGDGILPAFRCENIRIYVKNKYIEKNNVIIGVLSTNFNDEYSAIISPNLLTE